MRGRIQDVIRFWIGHAVRAFGRYLSRRHVRQVADFASNQRRLRDRYGVTDATPIAQNEQSDPLNTLGRARQAESLLMNDFYRTVATIEIPRTSLYVFGAFEVEQTQSPEDAAPLPPYLATLQMPYQVHRHPAVMALESQYGRPAVCLWVLILSNPGVLYVKNPFTLSIFLEGLSTDWASAVGLVRAWHDDPTAFEVPVRQIAARIDSEGASERVGRIAGSEMPLTLLECVPAVGVLCCWAGELVRPALDRVWAHIPRNTVHHFPMHSVSANGVETVLHFQGQEARLLPMAPGVLYEFLPIGEQTEGALLDATALELDALYVLVVSDALGLRRHCTQSVFRVRAMVEGLPDLRFERHVGRPFSFLQEKLTEDDARSAIAQVLAYRPDMESAAWLTVMPSAGTPPCYRFIVAGDAPVTELEDAGKLLDKALAFANHDYADHRRNGHLGPVVAVQMSYEEAILHVHGGPLEPDAEARFKFLPFVHAVANSEA